MIEMKRNIENPLLTPDDVKPSQPGFKVEGVFNCGACKYNDETILICRVAESVLSDDAKNHKIPIVVCKNGEDTIEVISLKESDYPEYDFSDSRTIRRKDDKSAVYLTSLSHLRLARSKDGVHFTIDETPFIFPSSLDESWGMEDPRVTCIDGVYYITYTSVSPNGPAASMISTKDFVNFERMGVIFAPENKDVMLFPEKINGMYLALNRPVSAAFGTPDIWIAESPDLSHWGNQKHFYGVSRESAWENGRTGGGAPPILTDKGWLMIYHAADKNDRYSMGAFLLDKEDPMKITAHTTKPIISPEAIYEMEGFFGGVVFGCGAVLEGDTVILYYGASDDKVCRADISLTELLDEMEYTIV